MATTTNYGWTTPDDTALVKDGAAAIRTLGSSIDTSLNTALGTKKAGLVLLNTTSFSAVASQSMAANTFTATYENYRIIFNAALSVDTDFTFKFRSSGTDTSANYYSYNYSLFPVAGTVGAGTRVNNGSYIAFNGGLGTVNYVVEIRNPYVSGEKKFLNAQGISSALPSIHITGGELNSTSQFDSFTIAPQSGNMTGKVSVYGINL